LTGTILGIVGFGCVGREIAKRACGFNMRIRAVDLKPANKPDYVERLDGVDGLDLLLEDSDYLVVTVPYTETTHGMLNRERLSLLKPSAVLVGISRGEIIDESALVEHLRKGRLAAAALDIFVEEPLPERSPLWDIPNLLITPHVAGGTQFETERLLEIFVENLDRFLHGRRPLRNEVDKNRGF
jgi:phosphoglycerate dehydrogenase-like enzyme